MNLSSSINPDINQPEIDDSQSENQLDNLLALLADLAIVNQSESSAENSSQVASIPSDQESWQKQFQSTQILALPPAKELSSPGDRTSPQREEDLNSLMLSEGYLTDQKNGIHPVESSEKPTSQEPPDPLALLQDLLVGSEVSEVRDLIAYVDEKVANLEHKLYQPQELIHLLLPVITETLRVKIADSKEEVTKAIAPIINEMIKAKTQDDKESMSSALAPVLPSAVAQQVMQSPGEFATALAPEIGGAIKEQIRLERDVMVDALYPVIGSTISKYMVEVVRSINEKVVNTLSPEGISRKIRAKMQGVSEAELIFKESMPFVVQAVFLIHKASGLVIAESQPSDDQRLESEMVAGMLTAIRSFVNDCILRSGNVAELDSIEYGNSQIILEVAGYCYLAVVTQGQSPQWFISQMRKTLTTIVEVYDKPVKYFEGDPATIPGQVSLLLEDLRASALKVKTKAIKPPALLILIGVILGVILVPWGIRMYRYRINHRIESDTLLALSSAPSLSVYRLTVEANQGILKLGGRVPSQYLRQEAEKIAKTTASNLKLENHIIAVEVPTDPALTAAEVKRVTNLFNQMEGITISTKYTNGKVAVKGSVAQATDAQKITQAFEQIAGVKSVTNTVKPQHIKISTRIYFDQGSAKLNSMNAYDKVIQIKAFLDQYPERSLKIIGNSDPNGTLSKNQQLALDRSKAVWQALVNQGIDPRRLLIAGIGSPPDQNVNQPLWLSRYVEFELITSTVAGKSRKKSH